MERIGRYRVLARVGQGAAGAVYRAVDPLGREVALKLLLAGKSATPLQRRRFATEAQSLLRVRHPHVVELLDAGEEDGAPYLVLEWVPGETLAARLERKGPLVPSVAVGLVRKLAAALEVCHREGVLHRDLKPGNVILRAGSDEPVLTDFGLAKDLEASTGGSSLARSLRGGWLGTPGYWPPEQALGELESIGPASDVFGLGALLYASLTARPPLAGESLVEMLAAMDRPLVPPSAVRPGVPTSLDDICARCLAREPRDRYPDAATLGRDLDAWREPGAGPVVVRPRRPRQVPWTALVALAPLLGLAIGYLALRPTARQASPSAAPPSLGEAWAEAAAAPDAARCRGALTSLLERVSAGLARARPEERVDLLLRRAACLERLARAGEAAADLDVAALDPALPGCGEALHRWARHHERPGGRVPEHVLERIAAVRRRLIRDPWVELLEARLALETGDPAGALDIARRARAQLPGDPEPLRWEALVLAGLGDGLAARASLSEALALDHWDPWPRAALVEVLLGQGRADEALSAVGPLHELLGEDPRALLLRAACRDQVWRRDEALADLRAVLSRRPDEVEALRRLVRLLVEDGPSRELDQALERLTALAPQDPTPDCVRAVLAVWAGQGERVVELVLRARACARPGSAERRHLVLRACAMAYKAVSGRAVVERVARAQLAAAPEDPEGLYLLVRALNWKTDDAGRAEHDRVLARALELHPRDGLLRQAQALETEGAPGEELLDQLEADARTDPLTLGQVAHLRRQPLLARRAARRALDRDPTCHRALQVLGTCCLGAGDSEEALRLGQLARFTPPGLEDAEVCALVAKARGALHGAAEAEPGLRRAMRLWPADQEHAADLSQLLLDAGRPAEALAVCLSVVEAVGRLGGAGQLQLGLNTARAFSALGRHTDAAGLLDQINATHPTPDRLVELARARHRAGEMDRARQAVARALELDPGHVQARALRAELEGGGRPR